MIKLSQFTNQKVYQELCLQLPRGFNRNFSLSALLAILEPGTGKILRPQAHKKRPHLWVAVKSFIILGHNFTVVMCHGMV